MVGHWNVQCTLAVRGMRHAEKGLQTVDGAPMKECEEMARALAELIDAEWVEQGFPKGVPCGAASHWVEAQDALAAYRAARRATEE